MPRGAATAAYRPPRARRSGSRSITVKGIGSSAGLLQRDNVSVLLVHLVERELHLRVAFHWEINRSTIAEYQLACVVQLAAVRHAEAGRPMTRFLLPLCF